MGTPKPRAKRLGLGRTVRLRAYPILSDHLAVAVRGMFRQAAKHAKLDPHGELTEEQHSRAHAHLMSELCEVLDFGPGEGDA